jgi:leucyl-tRNA synthetase
MSQPICTSVLMCHAPIVIPPIGKARAKDCAATTEAMKAAALADAKVQAFLEGRPPKKVIVVQGKLVNIVV